MIRIAICDDNPLELKRLHKRLDDHIETQLADKSILVYPYNSSKNLYNDIQSKDVADIFILDVDMPYMNGFQLAYAIRKKNPVASILFMTAHMEYAAEGYKVQALRYINKMGKQNQLFEALDLAISTYEQQQNTFLTVVYNRNYFHIPYIDIIYVQRADRQLEIHTRTNDIIIDSRGLHELYELLRDDRFIFVDRGTFVNADYVQRIENNEIILINNEHLSISRRLVSDVKNSIASYWQ